MLCRFLQKIEMNKIDPFSWILMCFQCHMRVGVMQLAAKVCFLIGSLVLDWPPLSWTPEAAVRCCCLSLPSQTDSLASTT